MLRLWVILKRGGRCFDKIVEYTECAYKELNLRNRNLNSKTIYVNEINLFYRREKCLLPEQAHLTDLTLQTTF